MRYLNSTSELALIRPYSTKDLIYSSSNETALQTSAAFSSNLCVGAGSASNSDFSLQGNACGALFSLNERSIVFAEDIYERVYPASITKIMTAILACKYGNMDDVVTINWQDLELESGSQVVGLRIGDQITMKELMYGLLVHSGNDAAQAIARHIGGTPEKFVAMMNQEADALGMTGTHFMNPSGLHDERHYTTVYDIYLMLNEALKYDEFLSLIQIPVYEMRYLDADGNEKKVTVDATDRYITKQARPPKNVTILGGKTGTTSAAGSCLAVAAQNAYGQTYISVIVRSPDKTALYDDMNALLAMTNQ